MTTITQQLHQALDDLNHVATHLDVKQETEAVADALKGHKDAVVQMRRAMDDPSCVDGLDHDRPRREGNADDAGRTQYADPTGQAATVRNGARIQHRDLVRAISVLHQQCRVMQTSFVIGNVPGAKTALRTVTWKAGYVASVVARWQPHDPTAKERAETEAAHEPGCVSCARTEVRPGIKRWEPVANADYCEWCYRFKRKTGEVPTLAQLATHHAGTRVMVKA